MFFFLTCVNFPERSDTFNEELLSPSCEEFSLLWSLLHQFLRVFLEVTTAALKIRLIPLRNFLFAAARMAPNERRIVIFWNRRWESWYLRCLLKQVRFYCIKKVSLQNNVI